MLVLLDRPAIESVCCSSPVLRLLFWSGVHSDILTSFWRYMAVEAGHEASTLPIVFWSWKLCFQTSRRTRLSDPSGSRSVQLPTTGPHNPQTVVTDYSPSLRTGRTTAVDFKVYKYFINLNIIVFWPNWM
ncbi:hypothetical protein ElyMa_006308600 [Elysia marginata]|uniref:Uncharacterized protein n=1 Tax=Elysia marginata TaxID=1093978 RepID=A0AAV4HHF1_9GAST|nr:hypothetical protein ElyMa_006308600 [Elysia marginata]